MNLTFLGTFDKVYSYCRVSSNEQAEKRNSIEVQENRLKSILPKPDRIYRDVQSGDDSDRPDYISLVNQVRKDALAGLKVLVVITEQSRLSREGGDKVTSLIELFDSLGVCLYALDGGRQTVKDPTEWLMRNTEATFNQYFLRQLRRNLRAVKAQRRLENKPINPSPPYGYQWSREKYLIDSEKATIAKKVLLKYLPHPVGEGLSLAKSSDYAKSLGWKISPHGLRAWFKNPVIRGHLAYTEGGNSREDQKRKRSGELLAPKTQKIIFNTHEGIISESEYQSIERRMKDNRQYARQGTSKPRHALSGLVRCGECLEKMTHHVTIDKNGYGASKGYYENYVCRNRDCKVLHKSISRRIIEKELRKCITSQAATLAEMMDFETTKINPEVADLQNQISELKKIYSRTPISGIREAISELENRLSKLSEVPSQHGKEFRTELLKSFSDPKLFEMMSEPELRQVYHELVSEIRVWNRYKIQIDLNL